MQYIMTPHTYPRTPWAWWEGAFNEQEIDWLQDRARSATTNAFVGSGGLVKPDIRRSQVNWLTCTPETNWVYERLSDIAAILNAKHFQLNLTGFGEPLQLTNYNSKEDGMYGWHQDFGGKISRKLSLVLQLSDPADYEGGNLQVMNSANPENIRKQRGLIAAFPSYTLHQVEPVTKGTRQSLVAWVSGAPFV